MIIRKNIKGVLLMKNQNKLIHNKGFTLVEVAAVLVVGGLIISFAAASLQRYIESSQIRSTQTKLDEIDAALQQFVNINVLIPHRKNEA